MTTTPRTPRYWTSDSLQNFIEYFCLAQVQEDLRRNIKTMEMAINKGVIVELNDDPTLKRKMYADVYGQKGNRQKDKEITKQEVANMVFQVRTMTKEHGSTAKNVERSGVLFRNTTDVRTMNYAMDVFATIGNSVVTIQNEISRMTVALAEKQLEANNVVMDGFSKLFKSIEDGEKDMLVDRTTLNEIIRNRGRKTPSKVTNPEAATSKAITPKAINMLPCSSSSVNGLPCSSSTVNMLPCSSPPANISPSSSSARMVNDNKKEKEEFKRFAGNFSLIGSRKFMDVVNPWPGKEPKIPTQNRQENEEQQNRQENEEQQNSQEEQQNSQENEEEQESQGNYRSQENYPKSLMDVDLELFWNIEWAENINQSECVVDRNDYVINRNTKDQNSQSKREQGEDSGSRKRTRWE